MIANEKHTDEIEADVESGKSKGTGVPEPLPVKEFLEGAGKNTFIRPAGCVVIHH